MSWLKFILNSVNRAMGDDGDFDDDSDFDDGDFDDDSDFDDGELDGIEDLSSTFSNASEPHFGKNFLQASVETVVDIQDPGAVSEGLSKVYNQLQMHKDNPGVHNILSRVEQAINSGNTSEQQNVLRTAVRKFPQFVKLRFKGYD